MPMELLWDVASISEGLIARSLFSWSSHGVKVQGTIAFASCDWSHAKPYFKKKTATMKGTVMAWVLRVISLVLFFFVVNFFLYNFIRQNLKQATLHARLLRFFLPFFYFIRIPWFDLKLILSQLKYRETESCRVINHYKFSHELRI